MGLEPQAKAPNSSNWLVTVLYKVVGLYDLSNICNLDETPVPLQYLNGQTHNSIGAKQYGSKKRKVDGINERLVLFSVFLQMV